MALTQISTAGVKDDAVTSGKIPANAVGSSELADNAVDTAAIADQAVALSKLPHGDSNNNGKFLRANNGADPTFETVTGTTINNNADNRVITGSGTANTLEGESNLTFTSNVLKVQNGVSDANDSNLLHAVAGGTATRGIMLGTGRATGAAQNDGMGYIDAINTESNDYGAQLQFRIGGTRVMVIGYNSNDNVGIGNDYPLKKLTVQADQNTHGIFLTQSNDYDSGWGFHADDSSGALKIDRSINNNFGYRRATFHQDGGLCFGSDTAAANALDDYEEGTFSPIPNAGGGVTFTYAHNTGFYTKIGNTVTFQIYLMFYASTITGGNSGNGVAIQGLPFTIKNNGRYNPAFTVGRTYNFNIASDKRIYAYGEDNSTNIRMIVESDDTVGALLTAGQVDQSTCLTFISGTYQI